MRIPSVSIELNCKDILSLISKFSNEKSFSITSLILNDSITLEGKISVKAINFPFKSNITLLSCNNNNVIIKINSFNAINISIPNTIKELALKTLLSSISQNGITTSKDTISININKLILDYDISSLEINKLTINKDQISLILQNISTNKSLDELLSSVI